MAGFLEDKPKGRHPDGCLVRCPVCPKCVGKLVSPIFPIWTNYLLEYVLDFSITHLYLPIRLGEVWRGDAVVDVSFSCVVKTQRRWSNKIYKTKLTKTRYNNQVLGKYRVDPQRAGLTLIAELTWSNLGLKGVLNERK